MKLSTSYLIAASTAVGVVQCMSTFYPPYSSLGHGFTRRQYNPKDTANKSSKANLLSVKTLPPELNKSAVRKQFRFGPYQVPGSKEPSVGKVSDSEADALGSLAIVEMMESFCGGECVVLKGSASPEFENGTALSAAGGSVYNHHIFGINRDDVQPLHICPGSVKKPKRAAMTFIGGGTDQEYHLYTSPDGSFKGGYEVRKSDRLDLVAEFMNYLPESQEVVVAVDVEYLPGRPNGYLSSKAIQFIASPCDWADTFNVPAKQYTTSSKEWTVPDNGYIINIRGHEHDGGTGVFVSVNEKLVCSSLPTYEKVQNHFRVKEFSSCDTPIPLKKGDKIVMRADFDIEKYPQRESNDGHIETVLALTAMTLGFPSGYELSQ